MTHLVLGGGGHANALALRQLPQSLPRGGKITLVSDCADAPYSGMLPGFIAGHYQRAQCFIDLPRLAAACRAEFIQARIAGIEAAAGQLRFADGQRLAFDVLSLNTGASSPVLAPALAENGAAAADSASLSAVCAVKPIDAFMRWLQLQDNAVFESLAVVGAGAGGVETLLALAARWRDKQPRPRLLLVGEAFLPQLPAAMRDYVRQRLTAGGVEFVPARVVGYAGGKLLLADGGALACERVIVATPVAPPSWFGETGLARSDDGFLRVNAYLQSVPAENIFISGDAATHAQPLPKAGVMAVRQGKLLAHNLPRAAGWCGGDMKRFRCNRQALFIIGAGDNRHAVASRNGLVLDGGWVWRWKQYLDAAFMRKLRP